MLSHTDNIILIFRCTTLSCVIIVCSRIFISMLPCLEFMQWLHWYPCKTATPSLGSKAVIYIHTIATILCFLAFSINKSVYCYKIPLLLEFSNCNSTAIHQCCYIYWRNPRLSGSATPSLETDAVIYIRYTHNRNCSKRDCALLQLIGWRLNDYLILIIPKLQLYCLSRW